MQQARHQAQMRRMAGHRQGGDGHAPARGAPRPRAARCGTAADRRPAPPARVMQSGSTCPAYQPMPVASISQRRWRARPAATSRGTSARAVSTISQAVISACRITTGHRLKRAAGQEQEQRIDRRALRQEDALQALPPDSRRYRRRQRESRSRARRQEQDASEAPSPTANRRPRPARGVGASNAMLRRFRCPAPRARDNCRKGLAPARQQKARENWHLCAVD